MNKNVRFLVVLLFGCLISFAACAIEPDRCFSAPPGDGLAWDGRHLWLSSSGNFRIYKINPVNGEILDDFPSPDIAPRDLAFDGNYLWVLESDPVFGGFFKLDPDNGLVVDSIPLIALPPGTISPSGLTWGDGALWLSAVSVSVPMIYKINPTNGALLGSFQAPAGQFGFTGLAWGKNELWFSSGFLVSSNGFYKIDPGNGDVLDIIRYETTGPGLAFDGNSLWNNSPIESKTCSFDVSTTWQDAYEVLFEDARDLEIFRTFRDERLAQDARGRWYTNWIYRYSHEALQVLLDNPVLLETARSIINANVVAVEEALEGRTAVIRDTAKLLAFLDAYADEAPAGLKLLTSLLKFEIKRQQQNVNGGTFFGFEYSK